MAGTFEPGDLVRAFATLHGWTVAERTILVEGEHDQRFFGLADRLYVKKTGLRLFSKEITAFPTGIGDEGGAFGLQRHFHPLRAIMDIDVSQQGRKVFHAIALFDNDIPGVRGFNALTGQHLNYRKWRDVFLIQRSLPRTTRDPEQVGRLVEQANAPWRGMHCEIEDLVSIDFVRDFIKDNPQSIERGLQENAAGFHCFFKSHAKPGFVRFVEANAMLCDIERIVELIKSLRFHLGLDPDGEKE